MYSTIFYDYSLFLLLLVSHHIFLFKLFVDCNISSIIVNYRLASFPPSHHPYNLKMKASTWGQQRSTRHAHVVCLVLRASVSALIITVFFGRRLWSVDVDARRNENYHCNSRLRLHYAWWRDEHECWSTKVSVVDQSDQEFMIDHSTKFLD